MSDVIGYIIVTVYILLVLFFFGLTLYDKIRGTHYSCDWMGWHDGKGDTERFFGGCSIHATCSKCGKEAMQDSQGNWF